MRQEGASAGTAVCAQSSMGLVGRKACAEQAFTGSFSIQSAGRSVPAVSGSSHPLHQLIPQEHNVPALQCTAEGHLRFCLLKLAEQEQVFRHKGGRYQGCVAACFFP